ncbi:hypothetical protein AGMMS49921_09060 [Endomicrobiia bacterium]|nr:hypothetical protein AGMMS49921_09060 [Endomicrobiia bacterium]
MFFCVQKTSKNQEVNAEIFIFLQEILKIAKNQIKILKIEKLRVFSRTHTSA